MRYRGECFRAHNPRWSFEPLSGEGARRHGGRFNPPGVPALYLSTTYAEFSKRHRALMPGSGR
ncbi:MAG: RES family NAD+ phosphorylase [Paracoccus sp. (in: a-proteobacteria)]